MAVAGKSTSEERRGCKMTDRRVTIATFDQAAQARLAENVLKEAGIPVSVSDETVVAMEWLLSNAVGGVKVQVWEEDEDRAVATLEREFGQDGSGLGPVAIDEAEFAAEAETAEGDDDEERIAAVEPPGKVDDSVEAPEPESREDYARRLVFTAILGLLVPFVAFYAMYLLLNAAMGEGELSSRGRLDLYLGAAMTLTGLLWMAAVVGVFL